MNPPLTLVEVKNVRPIPLPLYCPLFDAFPSAPFVTVRILTSVKAFLRGESTVFKTAAIDHSATLPYYLADLTSLSVSEISVVSSLHVGGLPSETKPGLVLGCVSFNTAYEHDVIWRWVLELDRKRSRRRHAAPLIEKSCAGTPRADTDAQITIHK